MGENSFLRACETEHKKDASPKNKAFSSPTVLFEKALRYFDWCDKNPFYQTVQRKKPGEPAMVDNMIIPGETLEEMPIKRPYTEIALCIWLGVNKRYFDTFIWKHTKGELKDTEISPLWLDTIETILNIIRNQQFEGAAVGFFKENIISKSLGLVDKQEIKSELTTVKEVFKIGDKEFEI